jgi:hypothetical protein
MSLPGPSAAANFRPVTAHFGWVRAKDSGFWPDLGADEASDPGYRFHGEAVA